MNVFQLGLIGSWEADGARWRQVRPPIMRIWRHFITGAAMGFFENFPRFFQTSQTSPYPRRLNARHVAIVERNADALKGMRVLDIASHDGRWSFASLQAGAAHVIGIEPRQELIHGARETFDHYGVAPDRYQFLQGDVFDVLGGSIEVDVALCLGFFYHTVRHAELLDRISRTGARLIVIDTEVTPLQDSPPQSVDSNPRLVYGNPNLVQIFSEPVADEQMAYADSLTRDGQTLVGRPSRSAIEFMAQHFGYGTSTYAWAKHFDIGPADAEYMVDYSEGWRDTFYLTK